MGAGGHAGPGPSEGSAAQRKERIPMSSVNYRDELDQMDSDHQGR